MIGEYFNIEVVTDHILEQMYDAAWEKALYHAKVLTPEQITEVARAMRSTQWYKDAVENEDINEEEWEGTQEAKDINVITQYCIDSAILNIGSGDYLPELED